MKNKIVFTSYVCDLLLQNGETLAHIRPDLKNPHKNVFVFKDSPTFDSNFRAAILVQVASKKE